MHWRNVGCPLAFPCFPWPPDAPLASPSSRCYPLGSPDLPWLPFASPGLPWSHHGFPSPLGSAWPPWLRLASLPSAAPLALPLAVPLALPRLSHVQQHAFASRRRAELLTKQVRIQARRSQFNYFIGGVANRLFEHT